MQAAAARRTAGEALTTTASAATEAQKLSAILNGLAHLDAVQCKTAGSNFGSWGTSQCGAGYGDAYTGAAVFAFLTTQAKWPAGALAATYASDVTNGVNYLLSVASTQSISTNDNLVNICPGGTGSCILERLRRPDLLHRLRGIRH